MGIIDIAIIAVIALFFLSGLHKGFIWNLCVLGGTIISLVLAYLLMGTVSRAVIKNETIYNAMLSYTEGAEKIYDVDLAKEDITSLTNDQIDEIMERSNLPFPLRERVYDNIMDEAFKDSGITTLGDYFNESMVLSIVNIVSFLAVYLVFRILFTFLVFWIDYSFKFPRQRIGDAIVGGAIGLVRGVLDVSAVFMLVPIVLTVLPFDVIEEMINSSAMASFLHGSNIFLKLIPGTV